MQEILNSVFQYVPLYSHFLPFFAVLVIFLCKTTSFIVHYICTFIHSLYHSNTLHFIKNVTFKITHIVNIHNVTLFAFFI